jgi:hypothetical protein
MVPGDVNVQIVKAQIIGVIIISKVMLHDMLNTTSRGLGSVLSVMVLSSREQQVAVGVICDWITVWVHCHLVVGLSLDIP